MRKILIVFLALTLLLVACDGDMSGEAKKIPTNTGLTANDAVTCKDSDGGINYPVKGTVVISNNQQKTRLSNDDNRYTDFCTGVRLTEYYCNENGTNASEILGIISNHNCGAGFECFDGACVEVEQNETHNICSGTNCISVQGPGVDECQTNAECAPPQNETHKICSGYNCISVQGPGVDECQTNAQCAPPQNETNETHKVCLGTSCVEVEGSGVDECQTNAQCEAPGNETNSTCYDSDGGDDRYTYGYCEDGNGIIYDQCGSDLDYVLETRCGTQFCGVATLFCTFGCEGGVCRTSPENETNETHNVCDGTLCKAVSGPGIDECQTNLECSTGNETNQTYTGAFSIDSMPSGASVYINNAYKGLTYYYGEDYELGTYNVRLSRSGYVTWFGTYNMNYDGQTIAINITLTEEQSGNESNGSGNQS
jgi:hypothetical protein